MDKEEWLKQLKVGDTVILSRRHSMQIKKVERLTPTQVIVDNYRFRIKDGIEVGRNSWSWISIHKPTADLLEEMAIDRLKLQAKSIIDKLGIPQDRATLEKFIEAMKPFI